MPTVIALIRPHIGLAGPSPITRSGARSRPAAVRIAFASAVALVLLVGCSPPMEESPVYQAACHGPPLTSVEQRNQALEDGYEINRTYGCIDKASYLAMLDQQARAALASTPEALAKAEADRLRRVAEARVQADEDRSAQALALMRSALSPVDVNSASEFEIARVPTVGADVAAEIIRERARRPFSDWADLVNRVVGLSAAQTAVSASACGLTVDGASLPGVDPTGAAGPQLCARMQPASGY